MSTRAAIQGAGLAVLMVCSFSGCGGEGGFDVSGNVTFNGAPIPAGKIYFSPDGSKGNTGATGYATITGGKYDTALPGGGRTAGGAVTVRIEGWDPSATSQPAKGDTSGETTFQALFPSYETTADLGTAKTTKDFDVPAEAANRKDAIEANRNTGPQPRICLVPTCDRDRSGSDLELGDLADDSSTSTCEAGGGALKTRPAVETMLR